MDVISSGREAKTGPETPGDREQYWSQLNQAGTVGEAAGPWLGLFCETLPAAAIAGTVVLKTASGKYELAAQWPHDQLAPHTLFELTELAFEQGRGTIRESKSGTQLAYPLKVDQDIYGMVSLAISSSSMDVVRETMSQLQWGIGWLRDLLRSEQGLKQKNQDRHTRLALDILGDVLEPEDSRTAAHELVHRLVNEFSLERVCIGFLEKEQVRVATISHSASFGKQMNLVRLLGDAMHEAVEQQTIIHYPAEDRELPCITNAHEVLHTTHKTGDLLTIPLMVRDVPVGALMCECGRGDSFSEREIELLSGVAAFAGPLLVGKRENERHIVTKIVDSAKRQFARMFGAGYAGRKLSAFVAASLLLFFFLAKGTYQVSANGSIQGEIQRAIVAPFDGFILESHVRAGDKVDQDQILASLDDRDLALERLNWVSRKKERQVEFNKALDSRSRAETKIIEAQLAQADIQIEILDKQLARAKMKAPFKGLVVAGDLSQSVGAAVSRGDVLFEIAPLNAYRLTLLVDESQIAHVEQEQTGIFLTSSLPDTPFEFRVNKITPVAQAREGRTVFSIEAVIPWQVELLRPGMGGIGKINAGEKHLIWIWSRGLMHWLRMAFWGL